MSNYLLKVLTVRPFFFLWLAEIFSQIAMNMLNFVLIIVAFELAKSNTAVSAIVLSFTIPAIMFGILAGVYVDRWQKKKVLLLTNLARGVLLLLLGFLFHSNLLLIYVLSFLVASITQFFIPAETPMIPLLIKKKLLLSANSLFGLGIYGSIVVAYALSGFFLLLFGKMATFLILAGFFFLAAVFVMFIKPPKIRGEHGSMNGEIAASIAIKDEIKNLFALITKTKEIYHSLFLLTLSQVLILIVAVVGPGFAKEVLEMNINQFPFFFVTPAALGMVAGAVILGSFFHSHPKRVLTNTGIFLSAVAILLLPFSSIWKNFVLQIDGGIFYVVIILAFVLGVANSLVFVPSNTILQEEATEEMRGKIYGLLNTLVGIFSLFPIILVGGLADTFGVAKVITGIGLSLLLLLIFRLIFK